MTPSKETQSKGYTYGAVIYSPYDLRKQGMLASAAHTITGVVAEVTPLSFLSTA